MSEWRAYGAWRKAFAGRSLGRARPRARAVACPVGFAGFLARRFWAGRAARLWVGAGLAAASIAAASLSLVVHGTLARVLAADLGVPPAASSGAAGAARADTAPARSAAVRAGPVPPGARSAAVRAGGTTPLAGSTAGHPPTGATGSVAVGAAPAPARPVGTVPSTDEERAPRTAGHLPAGALVLRWKAAPGAAPLTPATLAALRQLASLAAALTGLPATPPVLALETTPLPVYARRADVPGAGRGTAPASTRALGRLRLAAVQGVTTRLRWVAGRAFGTAVDPDGAVEAGVSWTAARALGLRVGQTLDVAIAGSSSRRTTLRLRLAGIFAPPPAADLPPYPGGDGDLLVPYALLARAPVSLPHGLPLYVGGRPATALERAAAGLPVSDASAYLALRVQDLRPSGVDAAYRGLTLLGALSARRLPGVTVALSPMPRLQAFRTTRALLRRQLAAAALPGLLGVLVLTVLGAWLVLWREREQLALLAARGASPAWLVGGYALEWAALGAAALALGPALAGLVLRATASLQGIAGPGTPWAGGAPWGVALVWAACPVAAGVAGALAPVLAALRRPGAGFEPPLGRHARAPWPLRWRLDLALCGSGLYAALAAAHTVAAAAAATRFGLQPWMPLRLQPAALLLVPAALLCGGTLLLARVLIALGRRAGADQPERVGLPAVLALRGLCRLPTAETVAAGLLALAVGSGVVATSAARSSQVLRHREALFRVGAPVRLRERVPAACDALLPVGGGLLCLKGGREVRPPAAPGAWPALLGWPPPPDPNLGLPGVAAAARVFIFDLAPWPQGSARVRYVQVDPATYGAAAAWPRGLDSRPLGAYLGVLQRDPLQVLLPGGAAAVPGVQAGDYLSEFPCLVYTPGCPPRIAATPAAWPGLDPAGPPIVVGAYAGPVPDQPPPGLYVAASGFRWSSTLTRAWPLAPLSFDELLRLKPGTRLSAVMAALRARGVTVTSVETLPDVEAAMAGRPTAQGPEVAWGVDAELSAAAACLAALLWWVLSAARRADDRWLLRALGAGRRSLALRGPLEAVLVIGAGVAGGLLAGGLVALLTDPWLLALSGRPPVTDVPAVVPHPWAWAAVAAAAAAAWLAGAAVDRPAREHAPAPGAVALRSAAPGAAAALGVPGVTAAGLSGTPSGLTEVARAGSVAWPSAEASPAPVGPPSGGRARRLRSGTASAESVLRPRHGRPAPSGVGAAASRGTVPAVGPVTASGAIRRAGPVMAAASTGRTLAAAGAGSISAACRAWWLGACRRAASRRAAAALTGALFLASLLAAAVPLATDAALAGVLRADLAPQNLRPAGAVLLLDDAQSAGRPVEPSTVARLRRVAAALPALTGLPATPTVVDAQSVTVPLAPITRDGRVGQVQSLVQFDLQPGWSAHVRWVRGRAPASRPEPGGVIEGAVEADVASGLGVRVGGLYALQPAPGYGPPLLRLRVVGLFERANPGGPAWPFRYLSSDVFVAPGALQALVAQYPRFIGLVAVYRVLQVQGLTPARAAGVAAGLREAEARVDLPGQALRQASPLGELSAYLTRAAALRALLLLLALPALAAALCLAALAADASLRAERPTLAVLSARGAGRGFLLAALAAGWLTPAALAAAAGPPAASLLAAAAFAATGLGGGVAGALRVALPSPAAFAYGAAAAAVGLGVALVRGGHACAVALPLERLRRGRVPAWPLWRRAWLDLLVLPPVLYELLVVRHRLAGGLTEPGAGPGLPPALFALSSLLVLAVALLLHRLLQAAAGLADRGGTELSPGLSAMVKRLHRSPAGWTAAWLLVAFAVGQGYAVAAGARTLGQDLQVLAGLQVGADVAAVEGWPSQCNEVAPFLTSGAGGEGSPYQRFQCYVQSRAWGRSVFAYQLPAPPPAPFAVNDTLPGVVAATPLEEWSGSASLPGAARAAAQVVGVDPATYPSAGWWHASVNPLPLSAYLDGLRRGRVYVDAAFWRATGLTVGQRVDVTLQGRTLALAVGGPVRAWPGAEPGQGLLVVGNGPDLERDFSLKPADYVALLRLRPGAATDALGPALQARGLFLLSLSDRRAAASAGEASPEAVATRALLALELLVLTGAGLGGYLVLLRLEEEARGLEAGLLLALGVQRPEVAAAAALERLLLVGAAVGAGFVAGLLANRAFTPVLTRLQDLGGGVPPLVLGPAPWALGAFAALLLVGLAVNRGRRHAGPPLDPVGAAKVDG